MKFITFRRKDGQPEPGVLRDGDIVSLKGAGFHSLLDVIVAGQAARARIEDWTLKPPADAVTSLGSAQLLAPIPRPGKIACIGLNYRDHAMESNMEIPKVPTVFAKFATAVLGPGEPILLPRVSTKPDYEAEMAVVIGKAGRYIPAASWREHVFGYMNFNDVSARDYQMATSQWVMGKTFDTFAPMGPYIVSADEIADPHALDISITVNGEQLQHSNTSNLIFRIPELIEYLSSACTLEPGDVIATGTPSGVGFARKPPRFLKAGDEVIVRVEGLGELKNPVANEI